MMKTYLLLVNMLVLSFGLHAQMNTEDGMSKRISEESKMQVMMNMQKLRMALLNKDSAQLDEVLAADVTYGHSNGWNQSKAELIRAVMSGEQDYNKMEPKAMSIRLHGNTAVVNYESFVALKLNGEPMEMHLDILLVWVKINNQWKLIARQSAKNS